MCRSGGIADRGAGGWQTPSMVNCSFKLFLVDLQISLYTVRKVEVVSGFVNDLKANSMLLRFFLWLSYLFFVTIRFIGKLHNCCAILMAHPAKVTPWLTVNNVRDQLYPVLTESSVRYQPQFQFTSPLAWQQCL